MGSRGGALVGGLGDEVPQKLKNFKSTSRFYAFLVLFHTFHLYMPMFFSRGGRPGRCLRNEVPQKLKNF